MSVLISSDLHLTDLPRDEYRWGLFPWLKGKAKEYNVDTLLFLGDTTDSKDKHSAKLTNRIVESFKSLDVKRIIILRGNHDYIDEDNPFFKFLNYLDNIHFILKPTSMFLDIGLCQFFPNTKQFESVCKPNPEAQWIFCHQTFEGSLGENGWVMDGVNTSVFDGWAGAVISGDIHTPQQIEDGKITYVGSPYHVRFNDTFTPRVLLVDGTEYKDLHYPTLQRHTIVVSSPEEFKKMQFNKGDQIKVKLNLEDSTNWENYKAEIIEHCSEQDIDLYQVKFLKKDSLQSLQAQEEKLKSLTPQQIFERFCKYSKVGEETATYGAKILNALIT